MPRVKRVRRALYEYQYRVSQQNENVCMDCRWYHEKTSRCEVVNMEVSKVGTCSVWNRKTNGGNENE